MIKKTTSLCSAIMCMLLACTGANGSSILVPSMTLLSTEAFVPHHKIKIEKTIHKINEERCMSLGLYHEARGEPVIGQYAVGATILNRVRSSAYPNTVCGVVYQNAHQKYRCQFSFACDDISDEPRNVKSFLKMQRLAKIMITKGLAREAKFLGHSFQYAVGNMTHYHRQDVSPVWSKELKQVSALGAHVFFMSNRVTRRYRY